MINFDDAGKILAEMVQIGRTFRVAGQQSATRSLTGTRYGFLQTLNHGDARLGELARRLLVSAPVASRTVDSLEADGLVERRTDPEDARALLISVTDLGRAYVAESDTRAVHKFAETLTEWSPADAEQAVALLRELNMRLAEVLGASAIAASTPAQGNNTNGSEIRG